MTDPQSEVLSSLIQRVLDEQLERSPALRELARHLATLTLQRLEEFDRPPAPIAKAPTRQTRPTPPTAIAPLRLGDTQTQVAVIGDSRSVEAARKAAQEQASLSGERYNYLERTARARQTDLSLVATRCRLKAKSCRHQILRQHQQRETREELESRQLMNELIAQAKTMDDCFLWMFFRDKPTTADAELETIARCYEAVAEAADLCGHLEPIDQQRDREAVGEALQLLSTSCGALRVALGATWLTQPDIDQDEVHHWLKLVTAEHGYHVRRHMQLDDPADPRADGPEAAREAREKLAGLREQRAQRDRGQRLFKKAMYHADRAREITRSPYDQEPPIHDCTRVNQAIDELASMDPPQLEAMLQQLAVAIAPDDFPMGVRPHALLEGASKRSQTHAKPRAEVVVEPRERVWSEGVRSVREMLRGGKIVIVGGEPRREAIDRISRAFELDGVEWPTLAEHGIAEPMRAPIEDQSTKLVVILIKLTGHEHADRAREFARRAGVPVVHMPAGYNPEQIAAEVLKQVSEQLCPA